mmetsp:Transcript_43705/g.78454  ORF Transcript_43705/g.78454 Transcript_43705/m.78454 type:complete len:85 (-) Transcript_43705:35-289(-)
MVMVTLKETRSSKQQIAHYLLYVWNDCKCLSQLHLYFLLLFQSSYRNYTMEMLNELPPLARHTIAVAFHISRSSTDDKACSVDI